MKCIVCDSIFLEIVNNKIFCKNCNSTFDIINNIPIMINTKDLNKQELRQKSFFDKS